MSEKTPIKVTQAPLGNGIPRALIVVVVALAIIIVVFAVVPSLENAFAPQPNVSLSGVTETTTGCGTGNSQQNFYTYSWQFQIVNKGNTNATVTVSILQHTPYSYSLTSHVFSVPKASQVPGTLSVSLPQQDCNRVDLTPTITSTT